MGFALLAQADGFTNATGWGAAGLLGMVLSWVFLKLIPDERKQRAEEAAAKDEMMKGLIADCDSHTKEIAENFSAHVKGIVGDFLSQVQQQRGDFQQALTFVTTHSEKHVQLLADALRTEFRVMSDAVKHELKESRERPAKREGGPK